MRRQSAWSSRAREDAARSLTTTTHRGVSRLSPAPDRAAPTIVTFANVEVDNTSSYPCKAIVQVPGRIVCLYLDLSIGIAYQYDEVTPPNTNEASSSPNTKFLY